MDARGWRGFKCNENKEEAGEGQRPSEMVQYFINNQDTWGKVVFEKKKKNCVIIVAK